MIRSHLCTRTRILFLNSQKSCISYSSTKDTGLEAEASKDAGRYLCEFIFYKSLAAQNGRALFVHVPDYDKPYNVKQLGEALKLVSTELIRQTKP